MVPTVVYDANVLFPNTLRDLLLRAAQADLVRAKWTDTILDEMLAALADSRRNPPESVDDILRQLERSGLVESVAALRLS